MSADSPALPLGRTDIGFVGAPFGIAGERPWAVGGSGGIQAGYNYQFPNKWVLGVEGDVGAANIHGGRTCRRCQRRS